MKTITKSIAQVCYALLFLISAKALSQESPSFKITPELTKSIVEKYKTDYPDVFSVVFKDIEYNKTGTNDAIKRKAFMIINPSIDSDSLNGEFIKLKDNYRVAIVDIENQFVKDEVFVDSEDVTYNRKMMSKRYDLIQKNGTNQYYYIMTENFISSVIKDQSIDKILEIVHKLGYKEYNNPNDSYDENLYIKSKTCEIKLDNWTYQELKTNPSYITALDNDQMKLNALIKQTIPHSQALDKYLGLYRIQRNKMSAANINAWRVATIQAGKLNDQIVKMDEKYAGNYSFMPLNKTNTRNAFSDNLRASKGILGI